MVDNKLPEVLPDKAPNAIPEKKVEEKHFEVEAPVAALSAGEPVHPRDAVSMKLASQPKHRAMADSPMMKNRYRVRNLMKQAVHVLINDNGLNVTKHIPVHGAIFLSQAELSDHCQALATRGHIQIIPIN